MEAWWGERHSKSKARSIQKLLQQQKKTVVDDPEGPLATIIDRVFAAMMSMMESLLEANNQRSTRMEESMIETNNSVN